MTQDERDEHHKVVDLVIRTTPGYQVRLLGNTAFAFKGPPDAPQLQRLTNAATTLLHELALHRRAATN